ncbi:MAG: glycoside hydrolase family 2 TIM barrel-domain containing protein, partial [Planctomycetota bacterium]
AWLYRYQDIDSPIFWKNMRAHAAATAQLYRNRPSVFMYSLGNELQHSPDGTATLPFSVRDAVKAVDPTRPLAFDDDDDYLRGGMDFICVHYPYPLGKHFLWPDDAFWWQTPMPVIFNRAPGVFDWKLDRPVVVGEMSDHSYAEAPDGVSAILGDKAYLRRPQSWIEGWLDGSRMIHDGARLSGVAGTNMWMTQWRDAFVYRALNPPIAALLRESDHTFYSGESVERTWSLLNDTLGKEDLELRWTLRTPVKVLTSGKVRKTLDPGGRDDITVNIPLPEVHDRSPVALEWEVFDGERLRDWDSRAYTVFPPLSDLGKASLMIYDPSGRTKEALEKVGFATSPSPTSPPTPSPVSTPSGSARTPFSTIPTMTLWPLPTSYPGAVA